MSVYSIPVTIGIDEDKIIESIHKNVESKVIDNISNEIKSRVDGVIYSRYGEKYEPLKAMIKGELSEIIKNNEEIIIQEAVKLLAEKMSRTKACKDAVAKVIENLVSE